MVIAPNGLYLLRALWVQAESSQQWIRTLNRSLGSPLHDPVGNNQDAFENLHPWLQRLRSGLYTTAWLPLV